MKSLNCCIVCYKTLHSLPSSNANENGKCTTAKFIRLFQRHFVNFSLESTQIKVTNSALTFLSKNGNYNEQIQLEACASCSKMLSLFNSAYGDLKFAEMKANYGLQRLANVIRFADYAPARRANFRESINHLEDSFLLIDDTIETISKFRKQLQHQCNLRHNNQYPRVVLLKPIPDQTRKYKDPPDGWVTAPPEANSKVSLILTTLKNLSSLQLVLYLAIFDSSFKDKTNISSISFEVNDSLKQRQKSFNWYSQSPKDSEEHENHFVDFSSSPPPSPVCSADDGDSIDEKWDLGDGVKCSTLDDNEEYIGPNSISDPLDEFSIEGCDSNEEKPTRNSENPSKKSTEYRIRIIRKLTPQQELQPLLVTCSKTVTTNVETNVPIKQEPTENSHPETKIKYTTHLKGSSERDRCNVCGKQYKNPSSLLYHKRTHLGAKAKKYSCTYCEKKFLLKDQMTRHIRTHTGEKPYKCPVGGCKMAFAQAISLSSHMNNHLGPKSMKFSCKHCGKRFSLKTGMTRHLRTHTGEKPLKCPAENCNLAYSYMQDLRTHVQKCHPNSTIDRGRVGKNRHLTID